MMWRSSWPLLAPSVTDTGQMQGFNPALPPAPAASGKSRDSGLTGSLPKVGTTLSTLSSYLVTWRGRRPKSPPPLAGLLISSSRDGLDPRFPCRHLCHVSKWVWGTRGMWGQALGYTHGQAQVELVTEVVFLGNSCRWDGSSAPEMVVWGASALRYSPPVHSCSLQRVRYSQIIVT